MSDPLPVLYRTIRRFNPASFEFINLLEEFERNQWLSQEELAARRLDRIRALVRYAYENVPYYHDLYTRNHVHPSDLKNLVDFQNLPFLTKEEVVNNLDRLVAPARHGKLSLMETGGSTGMPLRCFIDNSYWAWMSAFEWLGRSWYGVREGEKIAWFWGAQPDLPHHGWLAFLKARIKQHRFLNVQYLTRDRMQAFAEMLVHWHPTMFLGYPSSIYLFARYVRENRITGIRPKLIEVTSEKFQDSHRQLIEDVFQCRTANAYGTREIGSIAFQCEAGHLHVTEGCHLEVIANGKPAQAGQTGEVVLTSLHQYGMPFIRYRIMDAAVAKSDPCLCGRGLPVLHELTGRTASFIVTSDGQYTDESFFEYAFQVKPEIARYQVYQPDPDQIEVRLVLRQKVDPAWLDELYKELQKPFGSKLRIAVKIVDEIPLTSSGKLLSVISDVPSDFI